MVNLPCICTWATAGTGIGLLLEDGPGRQLANTLPAALLVGTVHRINT